MYDNIFGEMIYKNGWEKIIDCEFWNVKQLKIVVSAYQTEQPNESQKDAYSRFVEDFGRISRMCYRKMAEYMKLIEEDILPYCRLKKMPEDITKLVSVNHVLFLESGSFAILFDSEWDDHGVAVLCTDTEMIAGPQDIVWMQE